MTIALQKGKAQEIKGGFIPLIQDIIEGFRTGAMNQRYGMINIKLDKAGGLTEALKLARAAKDKGCKLMVGNMVGTSLGMAPSFVVAQLCDFVDIDGPLLLKYDHPQGLVYDRGIVGVFDSQFWG